MPNIHPPLVAFPAALLVVALLLEVLSLVKKSEPLSYAARINLLIGSVMSLAAFFSGYQANEFADQTFKISDDVISRHHFYGRLLLFTVIPSCICKYAADFGSYHKNVFRYCSLFALFISVCLVAITGFLGGELVFRYGAGVYAVP